MDSSQPNVVLVTGIFNVLHPGHIRLLRYAKSLGDRLLVGILSDDLAQGVATRHEDQRRDAVEGLRSVDEAFIVRGSVTDAIDRLRPTLVVKGREHSDGPNPEQEVLARYGGRLLFSSGDSFFSVTDLIPTDQASSQTPGIALPREFMRYHEVTRDRLSGIVERMRQLRVLVIGDSIVDEYVSCHALGMSREDPTLVVTPVETRRFVGGAGIVAAHAGRLGASARLHSVVGRDGQADFLREQLSTWGVKHFLAEDSGRPTTTKQRFRANGKTLLRVSHLQQDSVSEEIQDQLADEVCSDVENHDLLIFSDFNYGVLTQPLIHAVTQRSREAGLLLAADSQTSSQVGDVSRFMDMDLLTPTEYEARVAMRNFEDGLVVLADQLRRAANAAVIVMTLAEDGVFIRGSAGESLATTDRIPALNSSPVDVAGAGDSLLVATAMAMATGATYNEAAVLGSLAAAIQVSATGNRPLGPETLLEAMAE